MFNRHCERSEAIQRRRFICGSRSISARLDCFASLAMTENVRFCHD
jgi:hypothetical protein